MKQKELMRCFNVILLISSVCEIGGIINENKDSDCVIEHFNVICEHSIPYIIPSNASAVIIKDYLQETISNETFAHESWSSVKILDITVNHDVNLRLFDGNFPLHNLKNLGIHSPGFNFEKHSFSLLEGLTRMQTLNLSLCQNLRSSAVLTILETLTHLDTLILDQIATLNPRFVYFDDAFIQMISMKKIRTLSLSGCNLNVHGPFHVKTPLRFLLNFDLSNTTIAFIGDKFITEIFTDQLLPNLKTFDLSFMKNNLLTINYGFLDNTINDICKRNNRFMNLLLRAEHVKLNNILSRILIANNSIVDFTKCKINLKSLQIRSNNIHFMNVSISWPSNLSLIEFDASSNDIEYLSPSLWGSVTSLEIIKLHDNKLYRMESLKEFKYLFTDHANLKYLDLSKNHLSALPFTLFSKNRNLTMLDLSYNKLTSISFDLKSLMNLQDLYIRNNHIHLIVNFDLNNLKEFIKSSPEYPKIYLENNPLVCKCESSPFIKWLHVYMKDTYNRSITCSINNRQELINLSVVKETEFSCVRSKIIIASVTTTLLVLIVVSMVTAFIFYKGRQQKRLRKRGNLLEDFRQGNLAEKYLCFVSYSSDDDESQIKRISAHIKETLQEMIHTDKEVLCENSEHFNIGFPIIDEVMRCISDSCVGIFFVTNNFCQSRWCELELRETYDLKKPIILIFKEEIDERKMSSLMLNIFRKFTRAKIVKDEDGQIEKIPDVKQFSNSIIKLASSRYNEDIENI